jgi:hypothetical protein
MVMPPHFFYPDLDLSCEPQTLYTDCYWAVLHTFQTQCILP